MLKALSRAYAALDDDTENCWLQCRCLRASDDFNLESKVNEKKREREITILINLWSCYVIGSNLEWEAILRLQIHSIFFRDWSKLHARKWLPDGVAK